MKRTNDHIEDYLDYYCELRDPGYAVMIKGSWGSGKTWFIRKYSEKLISDSKKVIHVSLYGVDNFNGITERIVVELFPLIPEKYNKSVQYFLNILKKVPKVNSWIPSTTDSLLMDIFLKKTKDCILIFDDLERCSIEEGKLLGYINNFVEFKNQKVILVAHEKEMGNSESYLRIKEKLVGKTFEIVTDVNDVIDNFIDSVSSDSTKKVLGENKDKMVEIYNLSTYNNLRHLKQSLLDFERFYKQLSKEAKAKPEFIDHILKLLFTFSFEIRHGKFESSDIKGLTSSYWVREKGQETKQSMFLKKYEIFDFSNLVISEECWFEFFDKGFVDIELLKESIFNSIYFQDQNTPDWIKLWHFMYLEDDEYERTLKGVVEKCEAREYKDIGVVRHIFGILLRLSKECVYNKTKDDIISDFKKYIDLLKEGGFLPKEEMELSLFYDSYKSLQFNEFDTPEFKDFSEYINARIKKSNLEGMPKEGKELLQLMISDTNAFSMRIRITNSSGLAYSQKPILNFIDSKEFVDEFMKLSPENRRFVMVTLEERYKHRNINDSLIEELVWLKQVKVLLEAIVEKNKGRISSYVIKSMLIKSLDKSIIALSNG